MKNIYVNGKGKVFFAKFASGTTTPGLERQMGNAPSFGVTFEPTYLDHYTSEGGIKVKDQSVAIQINRSGSLTLDNINQENLALLFFGSLDTVAQTAGPVTDEPHAVDALDRWIQLGQTAANPAGARSISAVTVTGPGGTPTYVLGTDYTVDLVRGRIYLPSTSTIPTTGNILVDYTKAAVSMPRVISGSTPIEGALRFVADNPAGENSDYYLPYVKITPNGEFNLISDEWLKLSFKLEVLKKDDATEAVYVNGVAHA